MCFILDVAIESIKKIKAKPVKSSIYGTIGAVLYGSALTNPDHNNFIDQFRAHENEVSMVAFDSQSKKATEYLKYLEQCKNNDVLRILSLGVVSLMWVDDHSSSLSTYDAVCEYLEPEYLTFNKRVIDIGLWGRWWNMENNMIDFDINY